MELLFPTFGEIVFRCICPFLLKVAFAYEITSEVFETVSKSNLCVDCMK